MIRKILFFSLALILVACVGSPPARLPALRTATESANRAAVHAIYAARWENAAESWREALTGYQAMDDWQGQGRARLGLGQAYARLGRGELVQKYLQDMPEQPLFSDVQRASAAYQLALLNLPSNPVRTQVFLTAARQLCGQRCLLAAQFDNLAARLAARQGDWVEVKRLAQRALDAAGSLPAEISHAHRLLAEAALAGNASLDARIHLEAAIAEDRQLAEPEWLLEDYRLLALVAISLGNEALEQEVLMRQKSLCAAVHLVACSGLSVGNP